MKLSTKNLLIILGVLALAFLTVQFTKRDGKSKTLRTELVSFDTARVSRIEISSPKGEVQLNRTEKGWEVELENGSKQTRENTVNSMLTTLNNIKPGRLAARKVDKWKDYSVDSTGTRVKVYNEDETLTDIVLGRFGVQDQQSFYTFVRLFEDENVYVANNFMKMGIFENANDYRNDEILRLQKDSLVSIRFDYPDSAFSLTGSQDWYIDDVKADSISVISFLQGLNFVSSKSFYDQSIPANPTHSISFSFSNRSELVIDGYMTEEGFIMKSSENDTEAFLDEAAKVKLFKGKGVFL